MARVSGSGTIMTPSLDIYGLVLNAQTLGDRKTAQFLKNHCASYSVSGGMLNITGLEVTDLEVNEFKQRGTVGRSRPARKRNGFSACSGLLPGQPHECSKNTLYNFCGVAGFKCRFKSFCFNTPFIALFLSQCIQCDMS